MKEQHPITSLKWDFFKIIAVTDSNEMKSKFRHLIPRDQSNLIKLMNCRRKI